MPRTAISKNARKDLAALGKIAARRKNPIRDFYLAGGTALAMHLSHRISFDLAFFTWKNFSPQALLSYFQENLACPKLNNVSISTGTLQFRCNSQISFFSYPYRLISKLTTAKEYPWLKLASIEDIALMKVTAISSRGEKKRFYRPVLCSKVP